MDDQHETPADETEGGTPAGHPVGHDGTRVDVTERTAWSVDGFAGLAVSLLLLGLGTWLFVLGVRAAEADEGGVGGIAGGVVLFVLGCVLAASLTIVAPGQTRVVQFFGRYVGTVRKQGLRMIVPLTTRRNVSVRVRNFETHELKVNDADGNPVNIAAIVVWQVADTAQGDVRRRGLRRLRRGAGRVGAAPRRDQPPLRQRRQRSQPCAADTEVIRRARRRGRRADRPRRARDHRGRASRQLAYAPEIAQAMLAAPAGRPRSSRPARRSSTARSAWSRAPWPSLEQKQIVDLDPERRAAMVSNLLVVLCAERGTTPVVNTGSLYT